MRNFTNIFVLISVTSNALFNLLTFQVVDNASHPDVVIRAKITTFITKFFLRNQLSQGLITEKK